MAATQSFGEPRALDLLRRPFNAVRRARRRIVLAGALAAHPEAPVWERELNRHHLACGCETAAVGAVSGVAFAVALTVHSAVAGSFDGGLVAASWVACILLGTAAGKLAGLLRANRRLNGVISKVQRLAG